MAWKNRRVLVTGAGGFIGSHLTERLVDAGARTRALVHYRGSGSWGWLDQSPAKDDVEVVAGDICDGDCMRRAMQGVEVVFHLAALIGIPYSYAAPASYVRTNIEGTLVVLQTARDYGVARVVHTSTSEVYGTARARLIAEDHALQGQSPYSATKIGADKLAEAFHRSFAVPVVTVRPFNAYGPRQSTRAVIPTIITQALSADLIRLGRTEPLRDFTFISDTVEGFMRAADADAAVGHVVNLGSGEAVSVLNLARTILQIVGRDLPIEHDAGRDRPDESEVDRLCADIGLARTLFGWRPTRSLTDGLRETVQWYRSNLDLYKAGVYGV